MLRQKVLFVDEPGEHLLKLTRQAPAALTLELWWFDDWTSHDFNSDKKHIMTRPVAFYEFEQAVLRTLGALQEQWGLKGYKHRWGRPFPSKEYETLWGDVR